MTSNLFLDTIKYLTTIHHFTVTRNNLIRVSTLIGDMITGTVNLDSPDKAVDVAVFIKHNGDLDYFELWDKDDADYDNLPRIHPSDASDGEHLAMLIACEAVALHERVRVAIEEGR